MSTSAPVLLAGPGLLDALDAGATYVLTGAEARHAAVVQRRRPGERVDVVDTEGVRLRCRIASFEGGSLTAWDQRSEDQRSFAVHRITGVRAVPPGTAGPAGPAQ